MSITQRIPDEERAVPGGERQAVERARRELNTLPKNNLDATQAPTANDDSTLGYLEGSRWVDVTNDYAYTCVDATPTAAVWVGGAAGSGDVTGPAGAVAGNLPSYADNTGKVLNDSGIAAADVSAHLSDTANPHSVTAAQAGAIPNPGGEEQGSLPYYGAAAWALLAHGDAEALLSSGGHGANPAWTASGTAERGDTLYRGASAGWTRLAHGTAGQVYFTGGHGADPAWASNLYWDETNDRLGVGIAAPLGRLHVSGAEGAYLDVASASAVPVWLLRRARGAVGAETAVQAYDTLGRLYAYGWETSYKAAGYLQFLALATWGANEHGTALQIGLNASGTSGASPELTASFIYGQEQFRWYGTVAPSASGNVCPVFAFIRGRGTSGSPAVPNDLDALGAVEWWGSQAAGENLGAWIQATARGAWSGTNYGTYLDFYVTPQNAVVPGLMARLYEGNWRVYRAAANAAVVASRCNTSLPAPSAVLSGEACGGFYVGGYDSAAWQTPLYMLGYATENWSATNRGMRWDLATVLTGGSTSVVHARARDRGFWQICYTAAPASADADNSMAALYVDEAGKTLYARVKLSGGTVKDVALGTWP